LEKYYLSGFWHKDYPVSAQDYCILRALLPNIKEEMAEREK